MSVSRYPFGVKECVRNRALIVSVENFYPDVDLIRPRDAKKDPLRLHKVLCKLGFSVVVKMDLEANEIWEAFKTGNIKTPLYIYVNNKIHLLLYKLPSRKFKRILKDLKY